MKEAATKFTTVDEYIASFPKNTQESLRQLRERIKQSAPAAEEVISYNIPAFKLKGMLVYFAAYNNHIGFYPTPSGVTAFKQELSGYKIAKSAIQFPLDQRLPLTLISKIVKYRVRENLEKAELKAR